MHEQERHGGRRDARQSRGVAERFGLASIELLLDLDRQPAHQPVIEILGQAYRLLFGPPRDLRLLTLDIPFVLDLDLDLFGDSRVLDRNAGARQLVNR